MNFDYTKIPQGYYDKILNGQKGLRKFWHFHKFDSVKRYIPEDHRGQDKSILDIGCFAGTFLGLVDENFFGHQVGIDILPSQIQYAQSQYGTNFRKFLSYDQNFNEGIGLNQKFDVITLIEVIEHLDPQSIQNLIKFAVNSLNPGGRLIITTPNYSSIWPLLEYILNRISDVKYEEQHLTKFSYFSFQNDLTKILVNTPLVCEKVTTTHFLTPFIAQVNYSLALKLSQMIPSAKWNNPFGSIILSCWKMA